MRNALPTGTLGVRLGPGNLERKSAVRREADIGSPEVEHVLCPSAHKEVRHDSSETKADKAVTGGVSQLGETPGDGSGQGDALGLGTVLVEPRVGEAIQRLGNEVRRARVGEAGGEVPFANGRQVRAGAGRLHRALEP